MRRLLAVPEWAWLALALSLRWAFALKVGSRMIQVDEHSMSSAAWSLATEGNLGPDHVLPVAASFFACFYKVVGLVPVVPRLGQGLLTTWTTWAIGRFTRETTGSENAGKLALAVSAVYPFFVYYSS
ncbi:MAG: hypothetical protein HY925_06865, partial [Elusimicrobia bacterium]|nr:hypothetical protein [Elusimicrobiota bacterium]